MTLLITGGLGYIGSAILEIISKEEEFQDIKKEDIIVLDNLQRWDGFSRYRRAKYVLPNLRFVLGDISKDSGLDHERLKDCIKKSDRVLHLAGVTDANYSKENPKLVHRTNFEGTRILIEAIHKHGQGIKKVVNAASCNSYGRPDKEGISFSEDFDGMKPLNPYAEAKLQGEKVCSEYWQKHKMPTVSLRMSTNFGYSDGIRFNLVINKFLLNALRGEDLSVYGDGTNWRPFIHVRDAALSFLAALNSGNEINGEVFNAGSNDLNLQIKDITKHIIQVTKKHIDFEPKVEFLANIDPALIGESYNVDFTKIRKMLGFRTRFDIESGIDDLAKKVLNKWEGDFFECR